VTESVEYLVETPGEDIPHLHVRVFAKHRGVQSRFSRLRIADGVLLSERVEGIASVAHALAFCQAAERATGTAVGEGARLTRVVHAELERVVNHVDVAMRLCDAAGLGVGTARMGWHKERLQRLVSRLCHSRFGRGVVVPGGVTAFPALSGEEIVASVASVRDDLLRDATVLMRTASFLDRLRGTGPLTYDEARALAALGPVGRASGYDDDDRVHRPYAAYDVVVPQRVVRREGDAQARLQARWGEVEDSFRLLREAALALEPHRSETAAVPVPHVDGRAVGWAEAPQGEVLYDVEVASGRVVRAAARSASMHNLAIFSTVFRGDIFTDFPFIEASFGVSIAGVVM
jgi:Ni,Fe-hydrogenase III large subunit